MLRAFPQHLTDTHEITKIKGGVGADTFVSSSWRCDNVGDEDGVALLRLQGAGLVQQEGDGILIPAGGSAVLSLQKFIESSEAVGDYTPFIEIVNILSGPDFGTVVDSHQFTLLIEAPPVVGPILQSFGTPTIT